MQWINRINGLRLQNEQSIMVFKTNKEIGLKRTSK